MPAKKSTAKKSEAVGWGIIGCGVIGPYHASSLKDTDAAKLVACCDVIPERARKLAEEYGPGIKAYASMDELLADPAVQAVSVCTPSGMHAAHVVAAAEAGKHILCEKPLDITLCAIDTAIAVAAANNVKLAAVFQRRTYPSSKRVREAVRSGKLGKLVLGDAYQKYFRAHDYYASGAWRATWELDGGGCLMNQGVHGIDLLLYLMGPIKRLSAYARRLVRNIAVEDTAVAIVEFENGAVGVIEGTTSVTPGYDCKIEISGDNGTIVLHGDKIETWDIPGEEGQAEGAVADAGPGGDPTAALSATGHVHHMEDLCAAIKEDREPEIPGTEARRAVEVIKAIYLSSREGGCSIELPLSYEDDGPGI
jgi:UDP-N-acetyl-2-amino-2-deoxyglucuronate dehydrogenase